VASLGVEVLDNKARKARRDGVKVLGTQSRDLVGRIDVDNVGSTRDARSGQGCGHKVPGVLGRCGHDELEPEQVGVERLHRDCLARAIVARPFVERLGLREVRGVNELVEYAAPDGRPFVPPHECPVVRNARSEGTYQFLRHSAEIWAMSEAAMMIVLFLVFSVFLLGFGRVYGNLYNLLETCLFLVLTSSF